MHPCWRCRTTGCSKRQLCSSWHAIQPNRKNDVNRRQNRSLEEYKDEEECSRTPQTLLTSADFCSLSGKCPASTFPSGCVAKCLKQTHPPLLDPTDHGWSHTEGSTRITPTIVPLATPLAPDDLLKVITCGCDNNTPCSTESCGCKTHAIPCTLFCVCKGGDACRNKTVGLAELPWMN